MGFAADRKASPLLENAPVPLPAQKTTSTTSTTGTTGTTGTDKDPRPGPAAGRQPVRRRLYVVDGLRLVAALMVVFYHYVGFSEQDLWGQKNAAVFPTLHGPAAYGWLGVYLFFLISGFVICMSSWNRSLRQFLSSRFTRLYPAYWVGVAVTSIVLYAAPEPTRLRPSTILTNLTMVQRGLGVPEVDGVYWTLWAELRFYMLFAVVVSMGVTYRRVMAFCMIWMAAAVFAEYGDSHLLAAIVEPAYAPFFIGGVGIYLMYRFGPRPEVWLLIAASWLQGQHELVDLSHNAESHARADLSWTACACLVALFYAVLIAVARGRLQSFNWRWLTVAGALTYPLYLIHESIGFVVIRHAHRYFSPHVLVALLVVAMLAAAYAVNRLIEEPVARRLKKWLAEPRPPAGGELSRAAGARPRLPSR